MKREGFLNILLAAAGLLCLTPAALSFWRPAQRLTWTQGDSYNAAIATDSHNFIHVVWDDYTTGTPEIYYKRSTNLGAAWSPAQRLTWTAGSSARPAIAIDSNDIIHLVWDDDTPVNQEVYYKKSTDGGTTWSAAQRLTWTTGNSSFPAMTIAPNNTIHVVWQDSSAGNDEIYHKRSTNGGTAWSAAQRLSWTPGQTWYPAIAVDSMNTVHAVWKDYAADNDEIYYKEGANGGTAWSAAQRLTWTPGWSYTPAIAVDSTDKIHLLWKDDVASNQEIFYKSSSNGGTTWSAAQRLTWTPDNSHEPAMAIDSGNAIHVVWFEYASSTPEIFYKRSPDAGATWSVGERLTWTPGWSYSPAIAIDSYDNIHIVWHDGPPDDYEIYYKFGHYEIY